MFCVQCTNGATMCRCVWALIDALNIKAGYLALMLFEHG